MSASIRREETRLARAFTRALLLAAIAPAACDAPDVIDDGAGGESGAIASAAAPLQAEADRCAPASFTPDPPDRCGRYVHLACGLPAGVTPGANCYLWLNDCKKVCPGAYFNCHAVGDSCKDGEIVPDAKGNVDIDCATCAKGVGRIPAGLVSARMPRSASPLGDHFAAAAHLEAAAVHAFARLGRELALLGAPADLVRGAERARRDEVRHVRVMARLARRFGSRPIAAQVTPIADRSLADVALENAAEGCVRETFGALFATFQAERAADAEIAAALRSIARDETRHAALSWAILRWAEPRLDDAARGEIAHRCREAITALRREAGEGAPTTLRDAAGVPDREEQQALLAALEADLWRAWASEERAPHDGRRSGPRDPAIEHDQISAVPSR